MKTGNRTWYHNTFTEWTCRVLVRFDIVIPGFLGGDLDHFYPLDVLLLTLAAFWLYLYKLHIVAIFILLIAAFINYQHIIA